MFMQPPKTMGCHLEPLRILSLVQAYSSVVTTCTALVVVGYCPYRQHCSSLRRYGGTYGIDLTDGILRVVTRLEELLKDRLRSHTSVIEEHIKRDESPDVPGSKDLPYLGSGIWLPLLPAFESHALLRKCNLLFGQVEGLRDLW